MPDLHITGITRRQLPQYAPGIRAAVKRAFQCPGYEDDVMDDLLAQTAPVVQLCLDNDEQPAGFAYGYRAPAGGLGRLVNMPLDGLPASIRRADCEGGIGILKTIVTTPACQGQGIGTKLVRAVEQGLAKQHATQIIVPAWKAGARINIAGLMEKTGYAPGWTVDEIWKDDCDSGAFTCVDRADACICSAVFYCKRLT